MNAVDIFRIGTATDRGLSVPSAEVIGGKAQGLMRMACIGLPVPPAVVIGTRWCAPVLQCGGLPEALRNALPDALAWLQQRTRRAFGDPRRPLLVSVRSGAAFSMPGMMRTLLNVGLTDLTLPGLVRLSGNPRLAWDSYRRLVASYGEVVAGVPADEFEAENESLHISDLRQLDFAQLRNLTRRLLDVYRAAAGEPFPQEPREQLERAIYAVFASWRAPQAVDYRKVHGISEEAGTAVTLQASVFGNASGLSGAGVGFTRDPILGGAEPVIDFRFNAQGEDVVAGRLSTHGTLDLAEALPEVWRQLRDSAVRLEREFSDMQDFEFTVEDRQLFLLQSRPGKRSSLAGARIALDLCDEGVISRSEALRRLDAIEESALAITRVVADDGDELVPLATAASANTGVACGEIVFDEYRARQRSGTGAPVILVRRQAETADLAALTLASGLLTELGARTSHAAVVARHLGKVCLVGCRDLHIDRDRRAVRIGAMELPEGAVLTLDGNEGRVYAGKVRTVVERPKDLLNRISRLRNIASAN